MECYTEQFQSRHRLKRKLIFESFESKHIDILSYPIDLLSESHGDSDKSKMPYNDRKCPIMPWIDSIDPNAHHFQENSTYHFLGVYKNGWDSILRFSQ